MRSFLPIKGPGGRALTTREKIALLILGVTLVLCVLTMLAGKGAYLASDAQNPVFGFVGWLSRSFGAGIVALYGLVLVWSGLIYFKGERIADATPLSGRFAAALGVTIGISGALGIADLHSAGNLGTLVGTALGNTIGGALGFPLLLLLMLLGVNLAGQGALTALRQPALAVAPAATPYAPGSSFGLRDADGGRIVHEPPLPDDGDPSPDERSLAVTQAMEEIERSHGVTIVDVEPAADENSETIEERPSIGEEVEAAPVPAPETEEAEVQRGLAEIASRIGAAEPAAEEAEDAENEWYEPAQRDPEAELDEELEDEAEIAEQEAEELADDEEEEQEDVEEEAAEEYEEDVEEEELEEEEAGDPYAQGGLLRRLNANSEPATDDDSRPYASFDWRGRPLD